MVPGDDRAAAELQAARLTDPRATCFWDADHHAARAWAAEHAGRIVPKLLALFPPGAPEHEMLANWDPEAQPLWDIAWFYRAGATWPAGGLPEHVVWCKQFAFQGGEPGTSGFFRGAGWEAAVDWSSWDEQFAVGMESVAGR